MEHSKIHILEKILGNHRKVGNNISFCCPNMEHPDHKGGDIDYKLSVSLDKNVFNCWVCGYQGGIGGLVWEYGREYYHEFKYYLSDAQQKSVSSVLCRIPKDYTTKLSKKSRDRLKSRCIDKDAIKFYGIGSSNKDLKRYAGKILQPSFGLDGNMEYYVIDNYPDTPKYIFPSSWDYSINSFVSIPKSEYIMNIFNIDPNIPLVIVEGFYNAVSFWPYTNVTWLNGKVFYDKFKNYVFANKVPCLIWLDDETKANENTDLFVEECNANGVYAKKIGDYRHKDPNDFLKAGENDLLLTILNKEIETWVQTQQMEGY